MRLSRPSLLPASPYLALPMSLLLLVGLAGCGPASSDNAPTLGSPASVGEPSSSQKNQPPRTDLIASAANSATASPAPLASDNRNGSLPGKEPVSTKKPENPMDVLVVPAWIAKDLASPDVDTRLRALETWMLTAPVGSIDPLILAFETDDEQVRARAMELIQQDWSRAAGGGE